MKIKIRKDKETNEIIEVIFTVIGFCYLVFSVCYVISGNVADWIVRLMIVMSPIILFLIVCTLEIEKS